MCQIYQGLLGIGGAHVVLSSYKMVNSAIFMLEKFYLFI